MDAPPEVPPEVEAEPPIQQPPQQYLGGVNTTAATATPGGVGGMAPAESAGGEAPGNQAMLTGGTPAIISQANSIMRWVVDLQCSGLPLIRPPLGPVRVCSRVQNSDLNTSGPNGT